MTDHLCIELRENRAQSVAKYDTPAPAAALQDFVLVTEVSSDGIALMTGGLAMTKVLAELGVLNERLTSQAVKRLFVVSGERKRDRNVSSMVLGTLRSTLTSRNSDQCMQSPSKCIKAISALDVEVRSILYGFSTF